MMAGMKINLDRLLADLIFGGHPSLAAPRRLLVPPQAYHGTYGRLRVFWEKGGDQQEIGILNNFSIYADNSERTSNVPLNVTSVPTGNLRIVYEGDGPQRGKIFAEQIVKIGG